MSSYVESSWEKKDESFEVPLRPQSLNDFVGQKQVHDRLELFMNAALQRGEPLGHCLFYGPPGLGKTTLANIIAKTMNTNIITTSGPVIEKGGDLAGLLTNLKEGDILFIDEIHRLNKTIEEYLYPAMEDYSLDLVIDSGPSARSVQINLSRFTLVGATTRFGLISSPLRSRFALTSRLDYYTPDLLQTIIERTSHILNISISKEGSYTIAKRSRGTPRIANSLLRWVRDYAQIHKHSHIDDTVAIQALEMLSIDERGLDEMDKKFLSMIVENYQGGPVGVKTLAAGLGEEANTIEEVIEPYLIMQGFIKRTPRGREATPHAYTHLGKSMEKS